MKRTVCIKISPTKEQEKALFELRDEFCSGCTQIAKMALEKRCFSKANLHDLCYYQIREKGALGSQMTCNAIKTVAGAYRSLRSQRKQKDLPLIAFKKKSIHFDKRTYNLKKGQISLYTLEGRVLIPLALGERQKQELLGVAFKEAELVFTKGRWLFNLVVELPTPPRPKKKKVVKVGLGKNNLYATRTGKIINGEALFYKRERSSDLHRCLQHNGSECLRLEIKGLFSKRETCQEAEKEAPRLSHGGEF